MLTVRPRPSDELRCALCHGPAGDAEVCRGCGTLTHLECWRAEGRCPTPGCDLGASLPSPWWPVVALFAAILACRGLLELVSR